MLKLIEFTPKNISHVLVLLIFPVCVFGQNSPDLYANGYSESLELLTKLKTIIRDK